MNQSPAGMERLGRMLISGGVSFQAYMSPDPQLGPPGSDIFDLYERLERILQNPGQHVHEYNEIVRVFDFIELSASRDVLLLASPVGVSLWQVYALPSTGAQPVPIVCLSLGTQKIGSRAAALSGTAEEISEARKSEHRNYVFAACELEIFMESLSPGQAMRLGRQTPSKYLSKVGVVSRQHLEVRRASDSQYVITDLGSTNGTSYLNEQGRWVQLASGSEVLNSGTPLRIGSEADCVSLHIPGGDSYLLELQAQLSALLSALPVDRECTLGAIDEYVHLSSIPGMPDEALSIRKNSQGEYIVVSLTNNFPISFQRTGAEPLQRLEGAVSLGVGSGLVLGDPGSGVRVYLPGALVGHIRGLEDFSGLKIGRAASHLEIESYTAISRKHAVISKLPGGSLLVEDVGSTNGTFFRTPGTDWMKIEELVRVKTGSEIRLGSGEESLIFTVPF